MPKNEFNFRFCRIICRKYNVKTLQNRLLAKPNRRYFQVFFNALIDKFLPFFKQEFVA